MVAYVGDVRHVSWILRFLSGAMAEKLQEQSEILESKD